MAKNFRKIAAEDGIEQKESIDPVVETNDKTEENKPDSLYDEAEYKNQIMQISGVLDGLPYEDKKDGASDDWDLEEIDIPDRTKKATPSPTPPQEDESIPIGEEIAPKKDKIEIDEKDLNDLAESGAEVGIDIANSLQVALFGLGLGIKINRTRDYKALEDLHIDLSNKLSSGEATKDEQMMYAKIGTYLNKVEEWKKEKTNSFSIPAESRKKAALLLGKYFAITKEPPHPLLMVAAILLLPIIGNIIALGLLKPPKMS